MSVSAPLRVKGPDRKLHGGVFGRLKDSKMEFPDGSVQEIRISAGLAWYGEQMHAYGTLMKAADYALYDAKNSGKAMLKQYSLE